MRNNNKVITIYLGVENINFTFNTELVLFYNNNFLTTNNIDNFRNIWPSLTNNIIIDYVIDFIKKIIYIYILLIMIYMNRFFVLIQYYII